MTFLTKWAPVTALVFTACGATWFLAARVATTEATVDTIRGTVEDLDQTVEDLGGTGGLIVRAAATTPATSTLPHECSDYPAVAKWRSNA